MKKIIFVTLAMCLSLGVSFGQTEKLQQANNMYSQAEYKMAIKEYQEVLVNEGVAPEIFYNLANAYYKSNEIGRSILNYERALRLNPMFEDARYNLAIAQTKVVDNIVKAPTFVLFEWIQYLIKVLSSNAWLLFSVTFFILCLIFGFVFVFASLRTLRVISFYTLICMFVCSIITCTFSGIRKNQIENHHEAIVMSGVITAKSSPDKSGTDLFQLHEGTKVEVKSTLGNWIEIEIGNGSVGWVEKVHTETI